MLELARLTPTANELRLRRLAIGVSGVDQWTQRPTRLILLRFCNVEGKLISRQPFWVSRVCTESSYRAGNNRSPGRLRDKLRSVQLGLTGRPAPALYLDLPPNLPQTQIPLAVVWSERVVAVSAAR